MRDSKEPEMAPKQMAGTFISQEHSDMGGEVKLVWEQNALVYLAF